MFKEHSAVMLLIDPQTGKFLDANKAACKFYGYTLNEIKKKSVYDLNTLDNDKVLMQMAMAINHSRNYFLFEHRLSNGSKRQVEVHSTPVKMGDENSLFSIVYDVSERTRIEKELIKAKEKAEESDKLKSAFLANMSHEIRTPMNAITGFSQLLKSKKIDDIKKDLFVNKINQNSMILLRLIDDIIDTSKIESGLLKLYDNAFELNNLINNIHQSYTEQKKFRDFKQVEIKTSYPYNEINIKTDSTRLRQIIINLIENAIKFTEKGHIHFGYYQEERTLIFFVEDTGIGIHKEEQNEIFERFRQVDIGSTRKYGGTGLGLAICKGLITAMGGFIWLKSEPGKGSTFYFSLPLHEVSETEKAPQDENIIQTNFKWIGKKILIVEDQISNIELIKEILKDSKADLHIAENGNQAYDMYQRVQPDIILMDIQLPDIDGYEVTSKIRKTDSDTPIIAQTAFAMEDDKRKSYISGCNDYISKPLNPELLLYKINKFIGN